MTSPKLQPELQRILEARHHDPFAVLGRHPQDKKVVVRAHLPYAQEVHIAEGNLTDEIPLGREDELGQLNDALITMQTHLKAMMAEIAEACAK